MEQKYIRNFCIIAHIDHGKSTLADRLLEYTGTIPGRVMADQFLDQMDLERERGITIKAQAVKMLYKAQIGEHELNLIDTPGHVDFTYEVSRSLAACEGAILVVDASQGIQAQTLANVYLALEHNLAIIPVINKIDLPNAESERVAREIEDTLGFPRSEMIFASAKEGIGTREILDAVIQRVPPPSGEPDKPLRALIFDSKYDSYKGVIAYIRVFDGAISLNQRLRLMSTGKSMETLEIGVFKPWLTPVDSLSAGEVGYIATGLKNVRDCQVGDTITWDERPAQKALPGYRPLKPMVFAGLYPVEGREYPLLRDALDKLKLNDASLTYEPESSLALGSGFRCGFLGLLHMDIVQERLEREYNLSLLATAPSVEYQVVRYDGSEELVDNPSALPPTLQIQEIREPWLNVTILTSSKYIGAVMELATGRRGEYRKMEYLGLGTAPVWGEQKREVRSQSQETGAEEKRVLLEFELPLSETLVDFYDQLKSRTQGYASMDYSFSGYKPAPLVKLDILVNDQPVDALSLIVHKDKSYEQGKAIVEKLRSLIPRQLFDVPIQAAVGSKIIARETIKALRKNVLAKCYGGDVTRKRKLLEKQAEGKKRMKRIGRVEIPQEAFLALHRLGK
ncbi:MAG: elongation factor 4 [Chloroflexi bacterium]|nr:elongation factor 4 [Chloroflexota bacterium]